MLSLPKVAQIGKNGERWVEHLILIGFQAVFCFIDPIISASALLKRSAICVFPRLPNHPYREPSGAFQART